MLVFVEGGDQKTHRKTTGARQEPTTNSTQVWHQARIEPKPNPWETSTLITALSLLPKKNIYSQIIHKLQCKIWLDLPDHKLFSSGRIWTWVWKLWFWIKEHAARELSPKYPQIQGIPLCHSLISLSLALSPTAHDRCSLYRMAFKIALEINHTSCIGVSIHEPLLSVIFVTTKFINYQYWPWNLWLLHFHILWYTFTLL